MDTNETQETGGNVADTDERNSSGKRSYRKPTISDFVQPAVAFGSPSAYYVCTK